MITNSKELALFSIVMTGLLYTGTAASGYVEYINNLNLFYKIGIGILFSLGSSCISNAAFSACDYCKRNQKTAELNEVIAIHASNDAFRNSYGAILRHLPASEFDWGQHARECNALVSQYYSEITNDSFNRQTFSQLANELKKKCLEVTTLNESQYLEKLLEHGYQYSQQPSILIASPPYSVHSTPKRNMAIDAPPSKEFTPPEFDTSILYQNGLSL